MAEAEDDASPGRFFMSPRSRKRSSSAGNASGLSLSATFWAGVVVIASFLGWAPRASRAAASLARLVVVPIYVVMRAFARIAIAVAEFVLRRPLLPHVYARSTLLEEEAKLLRDIHHAWRHDERDITTSGGKWRVHSVWVNDCGAVGGGGQDGGAPSGDRDAAQSAASTNASTLVVVPGHSAGSALWACAADSLVEAHGGRVVLLDVPGWGRSAAPAAVTQASNDPDRVIDLYVELLDAWRRECGLGRVVLLGHSFGGFLSVQYASKYGAEVVERLMLANPAGICPIMSDNSFAQAAQFRFSAPQMFARSLGRLGLVMFRTAWNMTKPRDHPTFKFRDYYYCLAANTVGAGGKADVGFHSFIGFSWHVPQPLQAARAAIAADAAAGAAEHARDATHRRRHHRPRSKRAADAASRPRDSGLVGYLKANARYLGNLASQMLPRITACWNRPSISKLIHLEPEMRVSLVWGADDELVPVAYARLVHNLRPLTDLYIINDAEHNPAHDRVGAFAEAVSEALAAPPHPYLETTSESSSGIDEEGSVEEFDVNGDAVLLTSAVDAEASDVSVETSDELPFGGDDPETPCPSPERGTGLAEPDDTPTRRSYAAALLGGSTPTQLAGVVAPLESSDVRTTPTRNARRAQTMPSRQGTSDQAGGEQRAGAGAGASPPAPPRVSRQSSSASGAFEPPRCTRCGHELDLRTEKWGCGCGEWAFRALPGSRSTSARAESMAKFLKEVYVDREFDAASSPHVAPLLDSTSNRPSSFTAVRDMEASEDKSAERGRLFPTGSLRHM